MMLPDCRNSAPDVESNTGKRFAVTVAVAPIASMVSRIAASLMSSNRLSAKVEMDTAVDDASVTFTRVFDVLHWNVRPDDGDGSRRSLMVDVGASVTDRESDSSSCWIAIIRLSSPSSMLSAGREPAGVRSTPCLVGTMRLTRKLSLVEESTSTVDVIVKVPVDDGKVPATANCVEE